MSNYKYQPSTTTASSLCWVEIASWKERGMAHVKHSCTNDKVPCSDPASLPQHETGTFYKVARFWDDHILLMASRAFQIHWVIITEMLYIPLGFIFQIYYLKQLLRYLSLDGKQTRKKFVSTMPYLLFCLLKSWSANLFYFLTEMFFPKKRVLINKYKGPCSLYKMTDCYKMICNYT